ncbi:MAG: hypothetical protein CVV41_04725 [Candidatus Riflebacteria bacterium HGW-Riflebacteria-1]|jgi:hypothetical protein|nr:MAG: hypothetical protein CVV41_04725 [Candidatus Riflebacteria bacterium HGW-Riflebacteria-1]
MKKILKSALAGVLLVLLLAGNGYAEALHPFYEQNGDCYLLIGEGSAKAVWALNNLSSGIPNSLYDPYDAYGLTAAQKWNATANKSDKDLFTFAGTEGALTPMTGTRVPRRIIMSATTNIYGFATVPPATVHRFHGQPNASPTGLGNHPAGTINGLFGGIDYPCNRIPDPVPGMPGYYWYPVGQGYYHAADVVVWSNWTYGGANRRTWANPPPVGERYNQQTDGFPPTRGPWAACCAGRIPANGWILGGWVRRMIRENLFGAYRNLKLFKYRIGSGALTPAQIRDVANVLARVTGTMDMNGECCDGCIARVDGAAMPGVPSPHLSCVYSAIVDRSYLYRRDQGSTDFTLDGTTGEDRLIGSGGDTTCKFLGISSRSETGNYVYLLGLNQINQWLTDANAPPGMMLNELTDVAVSDQWWQTGGIVYAYDASKARVYRFVRNEAGASGIPAEIDVSAGGILPDKIGADGFGSLYLMRTEFEPADNSFFVPGAESRKYLAQVLAGGINLYRAEFKQKVYKSVYVRDYYTGVISRIPGRVLLGENTFYRDFFADDLNDSRTWAWVSPFGQFAPIIDANVRTELGVINSPTPPRPGNLDAVTDNYGPLVSVDDVYSPAVPDASGTLPDTADYWFMVENAPYFDANDVNIGNLGENPNGGPLGKFPNTIQRSSIKYYWKILQTHNRFNEPEEATILDMEAEGISGDYMLLFPPAAGRFKVGVKVAYRYYDYTKLPVGALSNRKGDVLKPALDLPPLVATGDDVNGYAWEEIHIRTVPVPPPVEGRGIIMSGIYGSGNSILSNFKPGPNFHPDKFGCMNPGWTNTVCRHPHCNPANDALTPTTFIIDGYSLVPQPPVYDESDDTWKISYSANAATWSLQLRESSYHLSRGRDRIDEMTGEDPPDPNDPGLIRSPKTLEWAGPLSVTWTSELKRGADTIVNRQLVTSSPILNLDQLRVLFPSPSEPAYYTLTVDFRRTYRYKVLKEIPQYIGGLPAAPRTVEVTRNVPMRIWSDAQVLVTDNTPPASHLANPEEAGKVLPAYFASTPVLYGTTGEPLWETESAPVSNPSALVFVVADNNPMANENYGNSGADIYHPGVRINFTLANQNATFSFQTPYGIMPPPRVPADPATPEQIRYSTGSSAASKVSGVHVTSESQFNTLTGTTGKYCKLFSYRAYSIDLRNITHFSKLLKEAAGVWDYTGEWSANMDLHHANNQAGYRSRLYGLSWSEASNSPTNVLKTAPILDGQVIVRDNDRPNMFIVATQDKYPDSTFYSPTNIKINTMPAKWVQFASPGMGSSINNGPESWESADNTASFNDDFKADAAAPVTNAIFPDGQDLEVDVPVRFNLVTSDNVGQVATVSFELRDDGDNVLLDGLFAANLPMQYVFRSPGEYKLTAVVQDNAVGWPANPQAYMPSDTSDPSAPPAPNKRKLRVLFKVVPTWLDFRVIERKRTGQ